MQDNKLNVIGAIGSPYTRKMVALLRYRHIPHTITWQEPSDVLKTIQVEEQPKIPFHPTVLFPQANKLPQAVCDTTPIIHRLEKEHITRSVIPKDPALAFINFLLEDFGDEWCTKYMFHYRWYPERDAENASTQLPYCLNPAMQEDAAKALKDYLHERQVSRLVYVGSNDTTAPIIDASYRRFLSLMDSLLNDQPFLLGNRPSSADYAIYGQFTQLIGFDPTPREIAHEIAPRMIAWMGNMEDLCGLEPEESDWNTNLENSDALKAILEEVGRVYVPALLANAKAHAAGDKSWETEIDGAIWTQQTFPYQAKCFHWIREEYSKLSDDDRIRVDKLMAGTGCELLIA